MVLRRRKKPPAGGSGWVREAGGYFGIAPYGLEKPGFHAGADEVNRSVYPGLRRIDAQIIQARIHPILAGKCADIRRPIAVVFFHELSGFRRVKVIQIFYSFDPGCRIGVQEEA